MRRVVVVGQGLAGTRLVTELHKRDPRLAITALGAEPHGPYNRILLTDVLAGTTQVTGIRLAEAPGADVRSGVAARAIDRADRTVMLSDGTSVKYDTLVLATGSTPRLPAVKGLLNDAGRLAPGVCFFRTVDDCQRIIELASTSSKALVLGGGLLGLETAWALARRGVAVEVLHAGDSVLDRHLEPEAGALLVRQLEQRGVKVRLRAAVAAALGAERVTGVRLADGQEVPGDLLVVACGVRPETDLAEAAGLRVGSGVVVDHRMRTADPAIYAIGDCAEHNGQVHGLVAPAWEQARAAADAITGAGARGSFVLPPAVTRLKTEGLELTVLGEAPSSGDPTRAYTSVAEFQDVDAGVYRRVLLNEGRIVRATILGRYPGLAELVELFEARQPLSTEQESRLTADSAGARADEADSPCADSLVCYCNSVTKARILRSCAAGARTIAAIAQQTRATTGCGICRSEVKEILASVRREG